ncbi:MAG TPA: hypothetical protein VNI01_10590 [Elusimicrobiota bacterium]|jgi:hypothetical protein|nr:hypothetical protein [Elusimicrobiota bacterium]
MRIRLRLMTDSRAGLETLRFLGEYRAVYRDVVLERVTWGPASDRAAFWALMGEVDDAGYAVLRLAGADVETLETREAETGER